MAKSVIILSVSVLLLVAVLLMLAFSGTDDDPAERDSYTDMGDGGEPFDLPGASGDKPDGGTPNPDEGKQPDLGEGGGEEEPPTPYEPEPDPEPDPPVVELPAGIKLPCNDFVATRATDWGEIVNLYYGEYRNEKGRVVDDAKLRAELMNMLAVYNGMNDGKAPIGARRALKLPRLYVVVDNDSLYKISQKCYGNAAAVDAIFNANPKITNKSLIKPGWLLLLP